MRVALTMMVSEEVVRVNQILDMFYFFFLDMF